MTNKVDISRRPNRAAKTTPAARYSGVSPSYLRKLRAKGRDDPGEKGPAFIRVSPYLVLYEYAELDRWLDERRNASAPQVVTKESQRKSQKNVLKTASALTA